jgi:hypothetical protein
MDLLTVTCNRDFQQMILQAESISKFVKPCIHWVIINEPDPDINYWRHHLTPYYKNHMLKVKPRLVESTVENGWYTQQLQKIAAAQLILKDYMVLDSKNFFIKNVDIDNFQHILGNGNQVPSSSYKKNVQRFLSHCSKLFNKPIPEKLLTEFTPFVIKYKPLVDVLQKYNTIELIPEYKNFGNYKVSEFLMYSILIQDLEEYQNFNEPVSSCTTVWGNYNDSNINPIITTEELKLLSYAFVNDNIKLLGFHYRLLNDASNVLHINNILRYLQFQSKLKVI